MRVAHLDTGREWRGGQGQVRLLLRGLAARGHETLLLAPRGPLLDRARAEGLAAEVWNSGGEWDVGAMLRATAALRAFAPAVAHAHSAHAHTLGVPAARLAGVPVAVVSRRVDFRVATNVGSRLKYRMPVDRYLCISRGVADVMRAAGIAERKLVLVPSGIELARPEESAAAPDLRALAGIPGGAPVFGTVAALAPHKNHADLLRAAAAVVRQAPEAHFVWIGEGECRAALERQRADLGLEGAVHLFGFRADAQRLMRQFTVFVLSSYLEGLCTSLLDAQALGVPIVATAVGGVPDVVQDGVNGRLVPGRDPAALATAMIEALREPERRAAWAARARETVRAFSADQMVERTVQAYRDALLDRGRKP
jgi:glycosyltransferase involved in cell wall biosynthesis